MEKDAEAVAILTKLVKEGEASEEV
jgi:hypothetical protein